MEDRDAIVVQSELSAETTPQTATPSSVAARLLLSVREHISPIILSSFAVLIGYWFRIYLRSGYIASIDLPGHIAIIERMLPQLGHFRLFFYDPGWFSGWPAFQFYAFAAHLLTAILAATVAPFSNAPVRLSCQVLLWLGCVALPFSVYYFVLPLARRIAKNDRLGSSDAAVLSLSTGFLSFWFLNHDYEWNGAGAAAALYIGLYSQIFAWHLLLLHGGAVARLLELPSKRRELIVCLSFAILWLTHTLTALFVLMVVVLLGIWFTRERILLWRLHLVALGLTAFWFIPAAGFAKQFAVTHIEWPAGDFFEIFFRYPFAALLEHLKGFSSGTFQPLDLGTLEVGVLFILFVSLVRVRRSEFAVALFLIVLSCAFLLSSNYVATSIPITFHYYRTMGYVLVYLTGLLAVVPMASCNALSVLLTNFAWCRWLPPSAIAIALLFGVYSTWSFPHSQREAVEISTIGGDLKADRQVLNYFRQLSDKGRVYFESFKDTPRSQYRLARYAESRLFAETGCETTSGLFIQSSLANQMVSQVAVRAGARAWSCPLYEFEKVDRSVSEVIRQLKEYGITHVVCNSNSEFFGKISPFHVQPIVCFEPYAIVPIDSPPFKKAAIPRKAIVGYVDRLGSLPFKYIEYYVSAHRKVNDKIELIDLTGLKIPDGLSALLLNDRIGRDSISGRQILELDPALPVMRICFQNDRFINHYRVEYHRTADDIMCVAVERFLDNFDFASEATKLRAFNSHDDLTPSLSWADDYQRIELRNLKPGHFVRVNYSYFPFWHSDNAEIYRGTAERIFVLPKTNHATLTYEPMRAAWTQIGIAISLASLLALPGVWSRLCSAFARRARKSGRPT